MILKGTLDDFRRLYETLQDSRIVLRTLEQTLEDSRRLLGGVLYLDQITLYFYPGNPLELTLSTNTMI